MRHLMRLCQIFRRPMMGVHNPTRGPLMDLLCMLCSPMMPSSTTMPLITQMRGALLDPSVRKVILVCHGTGAIPMTEALDRLHADLPMAVMSKCEIYTFGAAARHMNNPLLMLDEMCRRETAMPVPAGNGAGNGADRTRARSPNPAAGQWTRHDGSIVSPVKATLASMGHPIEDLERVMLHVEHYAMCGDIIAQCGVVDAVQSGMSRFAGRVFMIGDMGMNDKRNAGMDMGMRRDSGMRRMMEKMSKGMGMDMWMMNGKMDTPMVNGRIDSPTMNGKVDTSRKNDKMAVRMISGCGTFGAYMDCLFPRMVDADCSLDTVVRVDVQTAERREFTAQGIAMPAKAMHKIGMPMGLGITGVNGITAGANGRLSPDENTPRSRKDKRNSWGTAGALGLDGVGKARMAARECQGKTVRQLSRMWRFCGGERPVGEGVSMTMGCGMGMSVNGDGDGNGNRKNGGMQGEARSGAGGMM